MVNTFCLDYEHCVYAKFMVAIKQLFHKPKWVLGVLPHI